MFLILQIAINVMYFLYFDTKSIECDMKLDEKNGIHSFECVLFPS